MRFSGQSMKVYIKRRWVAVSKNKLEEIRTYKGINYQLIKQKSGKWEGFIYWNGLSNEPTSQGKLNALAMDHKCKSMIDRRVPSKSNKR